MGQLLETVGPRSGTAPQTYTLTELGTVDLQSVFASFDGSGASGSWLPAVTIRAQNGAILARVSPDQTLAIGDTADVTYAPFLRGAAATTAPVVSSGYNALPQSLGLQTWTVDPVLADTTLRPTATQLLTGVYLDSGVTVTSLSFWAGSVEITVPTHASMALYDSSFSRLRTTADTPSMGTSLGWKTPALTSTYTATYSGIFYVGVLFDVGNSTPSQIGVTGTATPDGNALPGGGRRSLCAAWAATWPATFVPTTSVSVSPLILVL